MFVKPVKTLLVKSLAITLVIIATLFPHPTLFYRQAVRYIRGPESLVDPQNPMLEPLAKEARLLLPRKNPYAVIKCVVNKHVQYQSDFKTWGMLDYWATVPETLTKRYEDCDGIAILTASLASRLGYTNYTICTTLDHMWVEFQDKPLIFAATNQRAGISIPSKHTEPPQAIGTIINLKQEIHSVCQTTCQYSTEFIQEIGVTRCCIILLEAGFIWNFSRLRIWVGLKKTLIGMISHI